GAPRAGTESGLSKPFCSAPAPGRPPDCREQLTALRRCRRQPTPHSRETKVDVRRRKAWRGKARPVFNHPLIPPYPEAIRLVQNHPGTGNPGAACQRQIQPGRHPTYFDIVLARARAADKPAILNTEVQIQNDLALRVNLKAITTGPTITGNQFENGSGPEKNTADGGRHERQIDACVQLCRW